MMDHRVVVQPLAVVVERQIVLVRLVVLVKMAEAAVAELGLQSAAAEAADLHALFAIQIQ